MAHFKDHKTKSRIISFDVAAAANDDNDDMEEKGKSYKNNSSE